MVNSSRVSAFKPWKSIWVSRTWWCDEVGRGHAGVWRSDGVPRRQMRIPAGVVKSSPADAEVC